MGKKADTGFSRLGKDDRLVTELCAQAWWKHLVEHSHRDPDINIQLRRDSINVYSKMGSLLKISMSGNDICCKIHYKYLLAEAKKPYAEIIPFGEELLVSGTVCSNIQNVLNPENFRTIKRNVAVYAGEEKVIQSRLVEKNKETIIDVEVAFTEKPGRDDDSAENTRIDFVNVDKSSQKLVFVELKQIFDSRLYNEEISNQIKKYHDFALKHKAQLVKAYQDAIKGKKKLGIIRESSFLSKATITTIEPRPLLVIAAYNQEIIDALRDKIRANLGKHGAIDHLSGLYFFGNEVDLNLSTHKYKNREVF